jgi:hypothetical protein
MRFSVIADDFARLRGTYAVHADYIDESGPRRIYDATYTLESMVRLP